MSYMIGVDIGGTCTDCVVVSDNGKITFGKAFSTPSDFSEGVLEAILITARELNIDVNALLGNTRLFLHSTTVAENAIVDGTLSKAGLLVTKGFEGTLFTMRGGYGRCAGLSEDEIKNPLETEKPPPLVPFSMIEGVKERTDSRGNIIVKADEIEIEKATKNLISKGAQSIGVCFLWSFENPENENITKRIIQKLYPGLLVTTSSEIAPTLGEYERMSTVALNSRLGPSVSTYINNLEKKLNELGFHDIILIMQAYGGLLTVKDASLRPVGMIESGPVSGLVGSKSLGDLLGFGDIIAVDMGGTTFKAGLIREGRIEYQREPLVARYHYSLPKMDVVSIGLAGGSIISIDARTDRPRIGPKSAGAYPGPVCYGFGGGDPTVTDVDLILGYLNPQFFLGGRAGLNRERATEVFKSKIADSLGLDVMEAAGAIYRLTNSIIFDLLHKTTIEKGIDPRGYALFAYGGTAGMHAAAFSEGLVNTIVIPYSASVHGAFGLSSADIVHEEMVTHLMRAPVNVDNINDIFTRLTDKVTRQLISEGFNKADIQIQRSIDMRFRRQVHVITTPLDMQGVLREIDMENIYNRFEMLYRERYGKESSYREAGIEMFSFRIRGIGILRKPRLKKQDLAKPDPDAAFIETRKVYIDKLRDVRNVNCFDFEKLHPGNEIKGPAVIWTPITTVVLNPGQRALCDMYKNIVIKYD